MSDNVQSAINIRHDNTMPLPVFEASKTKLLKIADVCYRLGVTRQTLNKIIKQGRIKTVRVSERNIRIAEHELNEFINRGME